MPDREAARAMARLRNEADLTCFALPQCSSNTKAVAEGYFFSVTEAIRHVVEDRQNGLKAVI